MEKCNVNHLAVVRRMKLTCKALILTSYNPHYGVKSKKLVTGNICLYKDRNGEIKGSMAVLIKKVAGFVDISLLSKRADIGLV